MLRTALMIGLVTVLALLLTACSGGGPDNVNKGQAGGGDTGTSSGDARSLPEESSNGIALPPHVPDEFRGKTNPFAADDAEAIKAGGKLYHELCSSCHGLQGAGDGPQAQMLAQMGMPPGVLTSAKVKRMPDEYYMWRVAEGGMAEPFFTAGSGMTPFGHIPEDERWQVIAFVRSLQK